MNKPLVSIITPCYNGEEFVDRYFKSILEQTYTNLELIFVNDGSTDNTEEIALSYKAKLENKGIHFLYLKQDNAGQATALNRGLKLFTGKYLTWPDSDDVMTPDCIEKKVEFLENHPTYDMVRSNGLYFNMETGEKKRIGETELDRKENIFIELILLKTYGCCGCYMITKNILENVYPQRDIFESRYGQNWQLLVPISSKTKCGYIDEDLYIIYDYKNSQSRKKKSCLTEIDRWNGFTEILIEALSHSDCDAENVEKMIYENCARNQFYYAVKLENKKLLKEFFEQLKKYGNPTLKECLLYLKYKYLR